MAGRKRKERERQQVPRTASAMVMREHMASLGLVNPWLYERWCVDHGFPASNAKTREDLGRELALHRSIQEKVARDARLHRNPRRLIEAACDGQVDAEAIGRPEWQEFCKSIAASNPDPEHRRSLKDFLLLANDKADFLFGTVDLNGSAYRYIDALIKLHDRRGLWLRRPEDWRKPTHNAARQFSSLVRHLVAAYPVPEFLDQVWWRTGPGTSRFRDWFIHIGRGHNIRNARIPFDMTKRMAHHFLEAPGSYTLEAALRWGQVIALGGDRRLVEALLATPIGTNFDNHEFWTSVIRFFIANPMLDRVHTGPLIDFLDHQKFRTQDLVTGPGQIESIPPPQPGLSMKGRTPQALLAQMDEWHGVLRKVKAPTDAWFKASGIAGYRNETGPRDNRRVWTIRELLSGAELVEEGRRMRHCVATYTQSCLRGECSIWSMEVQSQAGIEKRQTIEVSRDGAIVQARGPRNVYPTSSEFTVLSDWAKGAGLRVGSYVSTQD
ncbi:MAG: PcfJ domain-containing protein [Hyphomicrobiales bacterium]|nr:PcfJ domain-containing protein [Hyphomicrobiales bacterium]